MQTNFPSHSKIIPSQYVLCELVEIAMDCADLLGVSTEEAREEQFLINIALSIGNLCVGSFLFVQIGTFVKYDSVN